MFLVLQNLDPRMKLLLFQTCCASVPEHEHSSMGYHTAEVFKIISMMVHHFLPGTVFDLIISYSALGRLDVEPEEEDPST